MITVIMTIIMMIMIIIIIITIIIIIIITTTPRLGKTGLMSSGVSFISYGEGSSLGWQFF